VVKERATYQTSHISWLYCFNLAAAYAYVCKQHW